LNYEGLNNLTLEKTKKRPLRVAVIASERTVTEHRMFLGRLLVGLTDESIPATLVCPQDSNLDSIILGAADVIRYENIGLPLVDYFSRRLLIEGLAKFKPTILHCLCETRAGLVRQLGRQLNLPYVLTVNSLQDRWSRLAVSSRQCTRIIAPAESIAENLTRFYPRFADRVQQINIGTFTTQIPCCFREPSGTPTIVTAYPFRYDKEFENLFGALRHLLIEGYEYLMVIIGGGRAEEKLWKMLAALDMLKIVTIVPRTTPWRQVLGTADILIQPQPTSTFDVFLLEAMSVGTAIAGCKGGVDDLIIENETAAVFDPNDELSVFSSLQLLLSRREFARKIAHNAQEYLRKNHSVSNMISLFIQIYSEANEK
jgi:glycosyltransferase involved in cell wall biosynthesis